MIKLEERTTSKVTGDTSIYVSFDYKPEYVDFIKTLDGCSYNKTTKEWEVPIPYLQRLIDFFCLHDSITLELTKDKESAIITDTELDDYKYKPFGYQADGIQYGLTHDKWLLLFDMGLGKTLVITYLANELKRRGKIEHCLVICGVNSLKTNWCKEITKFTNLSCRILGERTTRTGNKVIGSVKEREEQLRNKIDEFFVITNIETLRSKEVVDAILNGPNKFDMIAVDEIHKCSSDPQAQQSQGLLKLTTAQYRVGLTGTLITNNPLNAYVPLKWIGAERSTYTNFKYFYCDFNDRFRTMINGFKHTNYLKDIIANNSLRRTKDVLDLPNKTIINEYVDMEKDQADFYNDIRRGIRDQVDKVVLRSSNILAMVARLRQATACPTMLTTSKISSAKIERAIDLVDEIIGNGDKVVVFSTFKETVGILSDRLAKYNPLIGTGDIKDSIVSDNIEIFQTDDSRKLFIGTWQKCGTGFTLTASRYLIFIDIPFTNASYTQAQDRIYRIGTSKPVFIYHLITNNTIDEHVLEIVEDKEALSDYLIDGELTQRALNKLRTFVENI